MTWAAAIFAEPAPVETSRTEAEALIDHLRVIDRQLQRWERQVAHPRGAGPSAEELDRLADHLRRLAPVAVKLETESSASAVERKLQVILNMVRALGEMSATGTLAKAEGGKSSHLRGILDEPALLPSIFYEEGFEEVRTKASQCGDALELKVGNWLLGQVSGSIWLRFLSEEDAPYRIDTLGSRTDTALTIRGGCSESATLLKTVDDRWSLRAAAQFTAEKGEPVYFRVESPDSETVQVLLEKVEGTGSISGKVLRRSDGTAIQNAEVRVAEEDGSSYRSTHTADDGSWSLGGLPSGRFHVYTATEDNLNTPEDESWLNQTWDGFDCGAGRDACQYIDKTALELRSGEALTGVVFRLGRGATLGGKVSDSISGQPVRGAGISLYDGTDTWPVWTSTDNLGRYEFSSLLNGSYRVEAERFGYASELYSERTCEGECDISVGDEILLGVDAEDTGIDFTLAPLASISGRVTDGTTGIAFAQVSILEPTGNHVTGTSADAEGYYRAGGLEANDYLVVADDLGFERVLWKDFLCPFGACDYSAGDRLSLLTSESRDGIDFELPVSGSLAGTLREAATSEPVSGLGRVQLYDDAGKLVDWRWTDGSDYRFDELREGTYYLWAEADGHRPEVWNDLGCWKEHQLLDCDVTSGDPIAVTMGVETVVDPELEALGAIEGTVSTSSPGDPPSWVDFAVYDANNLPIQTSVTRTENSYRIDSLRPGDYRLIVSNPEFGDELWDDVPCENKRCDLTSGSMISVALETTTPGIDFVLKRSGWIEGTVSDSVTGEPVNQGILAIYDNDGNRLDTQVLVGGAYTFNDLQAGEYFLVAEGEEHHLAEAWKDHHCFSFYDCEPTASTPVTVAYEAGTQVDWELERGAILGGSITTSGGDAPSGVIMIFDAEGNRKEITPMGPESWSFSGLAPGTYFALASSQPYRNQLFESIDCEEGCDPTAGSPITVGIGDTVTTIDFHLQRMPEISARVIDARTHEELRRGSTYLYDGNGQSVGFSTTRNPALFVGIPAGEYYLKARFQNYLDRIHGGEICNPDCDPTTGTRIVVEADDRVVSVDFPVEAGPGVIARIVDGSNGRGVADATLDIWSGNGQRLYTVAASEYGWLTQPLPTGTYFLSTNNQLGLPHELWKDVPCPDGPAAEGACDPLDGTPLVVERYEPAHEIIFVLGEPSQPFFTDGFESGNLSAWSQTAGDVSP